MKTAFKRALAALGTVALAGTLAVAVPTAAQAAHSASCSGSLVRSMPYRNNNGTVIANLGIYRSGTKVCAVAVKAGPLYGVSTHMQLNIWAWNYPQSDFDQGYFKYQTDALTIDVAGATPKRCATVKLAMLTKNNYYIPALNTDVCV